MLLDPVVSVGGVDSQRFGIEMKASEIYGRDLEEFIEVVALRSVEMPLALKAPLVEALVAKPGTLNENLLGMSFLKRLRSYEFSGDFLTLRG